MADPAAALLQNGAGMNGPSGLVQNMALGDVHHGPTDHADDMDMLEEEDIPDGPSQFQVCKPGMSIFPPGLDLHYHQMKFIPLK